MKRLLVLGSAGMLGHVVFTYLKEVKKYEVFDASFPEKFLQESILLDACNKKQVTETIENIKPDIIINCIGLLIKGSQQNPADAIYLNSFLPHQLSNLQRKHSGKLIHISTDCVFTGQKGCYVESDFKDARDIYGLSKMLGEVINDHDLTIRTSIIGPELKPDGEGLFHWFNKQQGKVNGYTKAFWSGVTTLELSKAIDAAIEQNISGLYHLSNVEKISKNDLLRLIKKIWNRYDIEIDPTDGKIIDKSLITSRSDFKYKVDSYEHMLIDLREFMKTNASMYKQYYE